MAQTTVPWDPGQDKEMPFFFFPSNAKVNFQ